MFIKTLLLFICASAITSKQLTNRRAFVNVPGLETFTEDADNRQTELDVRSILAARQWELPYMWHKYRVPLYENDTKKKSRCRCKKWKWKKGRSGDNFDTNTSLQDLQEDGQSKVIYLASPNPIRTETTKLILIFT